MYVLDTLGIAAGAKQLRLLTEPWLEASNLDEFFPFRPVNQDAISIKVKYGNMSGLVAENLVEELGVVSILEKDTESDQVALWIRTPQRASKSRAPLARNHVGKFWDFPLVCPTTQQSWASREYIGVFHET